MEFLLLISHNDAFMPTEQLVEDIRAWDDEMDGRGLRRDGRPLRPSQEAVTVCVRDGAREVTVGPATDGEQQTAAYELLECRDLNEALESAAAHPMAAAGSIEVRPVWEELAGGRTPRDGERALGRVVWSATMSLDGFIAGPGDTMGWAFDDAGPDLWVNRLMSETGALLAGRRSYDVSRRGERPEVKEAFGGGWSGAEFVLTHRDHDPDPAVTFLHGKIEDSVALALAAAGGKDVQIVGADVARQCLAAGLVDEVVIFVTPVLLGEGVRLVSRLDEAPVKLDLLETGRAGQVAHLRFRVRRGTEG